MQYKIKKGAYMRIQRGSKGFTLVELALVLVIIGLILGLIFKGGALVTSTKYKRLKMDWDSVITAIYTYQDRYYALPGDDLNADTNFDTSPAGLAKGDGNGYLDPSGTIILCDGTSYADEQCQAWWHLRLAGLIPGSETKAPKHPFGGHMAIAGTNGVGLGVDWPWAVCHANLQHKVAKLLDDRYDDGKFDNGSIRGTDNYEENPDKYTAWICTKG